MPISTLRSQSAIIELYFLSDRQSLLFSIGRLLWIHHLDDRFSQAVIPRNASRTFADMCFELRTARRSAPRSLMSGPFSLGEYVKFRDRGGGFGRHYPACTGTRRDFMPRPGCQGS